MANIINFENREKAMAQGGFQPEPKSGYGNDIFGMLVSIGLIFGGLSGTMVLRGTNSSPALVAVGFGFLALDIISMIRKSPPCKRPRRSVMSATAGCTIWKRPSGRTSAPCPHR